MKFISPIPILMSPLVKRQLYMLMSMDLTLTDHKRTFVGFLMIEKLMQPILILCFLQGLSMSIL